MQMRALPAPESPSRAVAAAQSLSPTQTLIQHVTVVNVATGEELRDQTVGIRGSRIISVGAAQPDGAATPGTIDAHGGYLIPGLWDMHIHVHDDAELPLYIANGVTGVRIMAGDRKTAAYRAELSRITPSPEIDLASVIVDGSSPMWPGSMVVKNPADARKAVDEIKASGADFVKVYDGIPRGAYLALADEARRQHIDSKGTSLSQSLGRKRRRQASALSNTSPELLSPAPVIRRP